MKKYICTICGYIFDESEGTLWDELPSDWLCPICKADKSAFIIQEDEVKQEVEINMNLEDREIQPFEFSAICSNLAKACEKQYLNEESQAFWDLSAATELKREPSKDNVISTMIKENDIDINEKFNISNSIVDKFNDRGGKRALVWSEKVSRMLNSVMNQYEKDGDSYLENSKVYVCEICGFIYVGDELPKVCPVCKVPNFKMKEIGRD